MGPVIGDAFVDGFVFTNLEFVEVLGVSSRTSKNVILSAIVSDKEATNVTAYRTKPEQPCVVKHHSDWTFAFEIFLAIPSYSKLLAFVFGNSNPSSDSSYHVIWYHRHKEGRRSHYEDYATATCHRVILGMINASTYEGFWSVSLNSICVHLYSCVSNTHRSFR